MKYTKILTLLLMIVAVILTARAALGETIGMEVSDISINNVDKGANVTTTFTVKNIGTVNLTNLNSDINAINTKYKLQLTGLPSTLEPNATATVTLALTVPTNEVSGEHSIGNLKITCTETSAKTVPIFLNPNSYLEISNIEVNGDGEDGELTPDGENEIEVEVSNEYTEDMEDVTVTVTILDVDGDDLEQEADSFDLDSNDDDSVSVKFDLTNENLDEEEYDVEIVVEGEADDNTDHKIVKILTLSIDRENHKVIISEAGLAPETIECLDGTTASIQAKNIGKSNEDDVQIRISNSALGLSDSQTFEVEKYSRDDNTYTAHFDINTDKATAGKYAITAELYLDGKKQDSQVLNLEVKECAKPSTQTTTQNTYSSEEETKKLQQQLEAELAARKLAEQNAASTSASTNSKGFRESDAYVIMLAGLVALIVIAVLIGLAVIARRPRK
jgi:hypothetical protein